MRLGLYTNKLGNSIINSIIWCNSIDSLLIVPVGFEISPGQEPWQSRSHSEGRSFMVESQHPQSVYIVPTVYDVIFPTQHCLM